MPELSQCEFLKTLAGGGLVSVVLWSKIEDPAPPSPFLESQVIHCLLKTISIETVLSKETFELCLTQDFLSIFNHKNLFKSKSLSSREINVWNTEIHLAASPAVFL